MSESNIILDSIKTGIYEVLKQLPVDRTFTGTVTKTLGNNTYLIRYDDADRKFKTKNTLSLSVGSVVHITYPQNDKTKKYMIEDVRI